MTFQNFFVINIWFKFDFQTAYDLDLVSHRWYIKIVLRGTNCRLPSMNFRTSAFRWLTHLVPCDYSDIHINCLSTLGFLIFTSLKLNTVYEYAPKTDVVSKGQNKQTWSKVWLEMDKRERQWPVISYKGESLKANKGEAALSWFTFTRQAHTNCF